MTHSQWGSIIECFKLPSYTFSLARLAILWLTQHSHTHICRTETQKKGVFIKIHEIREAPKQYWNAAAAVHNNKWSSFVTIAMDIQPAGCCCIVRFYSCPYSPIPTIFALLLLHFHKSRSTDNNKRGTIPCFSVSPHLNSIDGKIILLQEMHTLLYQSRQ